jgi:phosphate-selective porin OprO/OprP
MFVLIRYTIIATVFIAGVLCRIAPCVAADGKYVSILDKVWSYATLYVNEDNRFLQRFALSGRLQPDSTWFEADQGQFIDYFLWRRFRFGFKANLMQQWVFHIEADFDLNESPGNSYTRLTDAYIGWTPKKNLELKALKQSAGFTLDGATSSKKLLTLQRNDLTNNLWFTKEYFTGITAKGETSDNWHYKFGLFSSDGSDELSRFEASFFTLLSLGYSFPKSQKLNNGMIRIDHVYNKEDVNSATRDFSQILSLVTKWETSHVGLWTDLAGGIGYGDQSDVWGLVLMPFYNYNRYIQLVMRYTYLTSAENNGLRLPRYEGMIVKGRGNEYNEIYVGLNVYFYGHKLKWQTGFDYAAMKDESNDGGEYKGWGVNTGLRVYW